MSFEQMLVMHASPTLANMKPSSLISLKNLPACTSCMEKLRQRGLSFLPITTAKGVSLILIYRRKKLEEALQNPLSRNILSAFGYHGTLEEMLDQLSRRFLITDCPHEVGFFLGYPPGDVQGFIENKGENAIFSGVWKVYSDKEGALEILQKWTKCRRKYIECFLSGTEITRLCVTA